MEEDRRSLLKTQAKVLELEERIIKLEEIISFLIEKELEVAKEC